jgi:regulator of protease activity HflC (stomatin/prohibitin superfamily)
MVLCLECTNEATVGVVEQFGNYSGVITPGLNIICWPFSAVVGRLSLRVQQLEVSVETKTKDNVFVLVVVSVQYRVIRTKVQAAYYKLTDPRSQIRSYVFDTVRATVPRMELDEAFESKEEVAHSVKDHLAAEMENFGYEIIQALVVDLNPDQTVKKSMNEINASKRLREAAQYRADAEKITLVKAAEADAESKYLSGLGVAKQRKAIVSGLQESVHEFQSRVSGTSARDVLSLLMMTQYFDMLMSVGTRDKTTTIFTPSSNEGTTSQVRDGIMQAQQVK